MSTEPDVVPGETTARGPETPGAHATDEADRLPGPWRPRGEARPKMPWFDAEVFADVHVRFAVIIVAALVFLPGLGAFGLWDPWEVHYGEVGRQLLERGDWISPWWGSHWRSPARAAEGSYFFSKPILLLWMMGIGLQTFGFNEFGIRIGVAIIAMLGVGAAYLFGSRVFNRRVGLLMAGTLLTSPFYFMLGRQAQTDMPFVGLMTVALCFFMMGVFGKDRNRTLDRTSFIGFTIAVLAAVVPQLHTIVVGQMRWRYAEGEGAVAFIEALSQYGPFQAGLYVVMMAVFFVTAIYNRQRTRGQLYLWLFYAFVGLATMAKGILGFALPGAIIFLYLLASREWGLLKRVELFRGVLIALFVGFPWYGAVMARHGGVGGAWWQRFIIHDHFKRLATGVHQIDTGSFEHFIKWLGYGLFPWGSFVPAILARAFNGDAGSQRSDEDRARMFLFIWFAVAFSLFTLSSTKFHHYIFPAVPALALLAALTLDDILERRLSWQQLWPVWVAGLGLLLMVGYDLVTDPQHLKNMFTYRYDRRWDHEAWDHQMLPALRAVVGVGILGWILLAVRKIRGVVWMGAGVLFLNGLVFAVWALNVYMPMISPTWSQAGLWERYYALCTHVEPPPGAHPIKADWYCEESVISYKLNWRGETYYTQNEVIPIRDDDEWRFFIEQNGDRCFFGIMEHARVSAFRNALPAEQRASVQTAHECNIKFVLVSANCDPHTPAPPCPDADDEPETDAASDGSGEASGEGSGEGEEGSGAATP